MKSCSIAALLLAILLCPHLVAAQWSQVGDTLPKDCYVNDAQMAVAPDGTPYIVYEGSAGDYVVQKYNGNSWEQVGNVGLFYFNYEFAFAIDNNGILYLATDTFDHANGVDRRVVVKYDGNSWVGAGDASNFTNRYSGQLTYLVFDTMDAPCVSQGGQTIRYNGISWQQINGKSLNTGQLIATTNGHLFTSSGIKLIYQYRADTTWDALDTTGLDSVNTDGMYLSADPNGSLYALFFRIYKGNEERLFKYQNSKWTQVGRSFPYPTGILYPVFSENNVPYSTYFDGTTYKLQMMRFNGKDWVLADSAGRPAKDQYSGYPVADTKGNIYLPSQDTGQNTRTKVWKYNTNVDATAVKPAQLQDAITVYPIPASESLTIRNNIQSLNGSSATITDIKGSTVYRFRLGPLSHVETGDWNVGVYCLHLNDGQVLKIVKQ